MSSVRVERSLARKIWKKLIDGPVPIADKKDLARIDDFIERINRSIGTKSYIPDIVLGYLGLQKGSGVTRFIPILSKEDMAVYYQLCGQIGDAVLTRRDGIFGGWHSVPTTHKVNSMSKHRREEEEANNSNQSYMSDSFSNFLWLQEFKNFTALIKELTSRVDVGNFVIQTDIANFYDSIEIPRLIKRLRTRAPDLEEFIELLEMFLGIWNRRTTGYQQSSKGIPQEIISDASRILSHFYLQEFDENFQEYCLENGLQYVRWADDILVFGSSRSKLELSIHVASKFLLKDGLNLNSSKTKIFTRTDYAMYRGIPVLTEIDQKNKANFRRELRKFVKWSADNPARIDTVFRATIGFVHSLGADAKTYEKNFIFETIESDRDLAGTLSAIQLLRLIGIADNPSEMFSRLRRLFLSKPFAGRRANFLMLLRGKGKDLMKLGISKLIITNSIEMIENASEDSEVLRIYCVPAALNATKDL